MEMDRYRWMGKERSHERSRRTVPAPDAQAAIGTQASQHVALRVGGLTCAHCPPAIDKAIAATSGVTGALVNPTTQIARIDYDPARAKIVDIAQAIRSAGYTVGTATMRVPIKNIHCSSCVVRIELALRMTPGIVSARVDLVSNAAEIEYQPEQSTSPRFARLSNRPVIASPSRRLNLPAKPSTR
jgi:P-type Cu+ transporter